jgi:uncharacterized protein YcbX
MPQTGRTAPQQPARTPLGAQLGALHRYPLKSARGQALDRAEVEPWGLAADRRWTLLSAEGSALTQRQEPRLTQVSAVPLPNGGLKLSAPGAEPLTVTAPPAESAGGRPAPVKIFASRTAGIPAAESASRWFTELLGTAEGSVRLVHMDDPANRRPTDPDYSDPEDRVSYADGFPLLLTTTASLDALNTWIAQDDGPDAAPLPMNRFRPNAVVDGTEPWEEDNWRRISIGGLLFRVVKPCGRCVVTTTDQQTGERGRQPLRALARHHRIGRSAVFGQNLVPEPGAVGRTLRLGDPVRVLERAAAADS